jgi:predicted RNase H-like nuclease (RuvC/YqgF family)
LGPLHPEVVQSQIQLTAVELRLKATQPPTVDVLEARQADLLALLGPSHPEVRHAASQLEAARKASQPPVPAPKRLQNKLHFISTLDKRIAKHDSRIQDLQDKIYQAQCELAKTTEHRTHLVGRRATALEEKTAILQEMQDMDTPMPAADPAPSLASLLQGTARTP